MKNGIQHIIFSLAVWALLFAIVFPHALEERRAALHAVEIQEAELYRRYVINHTSRPVMMYGIRMRVITGSQTIANISHLYKGKAK